MVKYFVLSLMLCSAASATDVSGIWKVQASAGGNTVNPICSFKQEGTKLSGSCKYNDTSSDITGEVKDKEVTWKYDMEFDGQPITLTFLGKLDPDSEMKGSVQVAPMDISGEFSATKQQ